MLVTIGISFYNTETTLAEAIRSVFAQTFEDWELLLVDDGSTDRSLDIARSVQISKVRVIADGMNRGIPVRLNQINQEAKGKYIARMDGDDMMCPQRIERQVEFLEEHLDVDLVDTGVYSIDHSGQPKGKRGVAPLDPAPLTFLKGHGLIQPALLGRSEWFRRNPYDVHFRRAEDHELWCRVLGKAVFARMKEPLFFYRESDRRSPSSYFASLYYERKALRRHGPRLVGYGLTQRLILRSYLKSIIYWVMWISGTRKFLIRKRNVPLSEEERRSVTAVIERIRKTPVPGMVVK
jgi:glycosyltransferase involved in cell wall biosynthesis